jgi:glucose/arabinose dehydrogenase
MTSAPGKFSRRSARAAGVALACLLTACGTDNTLEPGDPTNADLALETVASGLNAPIFLTAPDGDSRLFIVEQGGQILVYDGGQISGTFLDISSKVGCCGERGLLSLAFHPQYASNGFFYVDYTDNAGDTKVERYTVSADPDVADAASAFEILSVAQPYSNHNGGLILFGPDDMLYVGLGDGGSGNDPLDSGQDLSTLLGAILRLDVDGGTPYGIPSDNPFVNQGAARPEIWLYGLRNPWRYSFDRGDGSLWIGDVGQGAWEEITTVAPGAGGLNLGWKIMEGTHCRGGGTCDMTGLTVPQYDYANPDAGCSVIGGYVYRGNAIPDVRGHYFFSDLCAGGVRSYRLDNQSVVDLIDWDLPVSTPYSFGEDPDGELYVLTGNGEVLKIVSADQP